MLQAETIEKRKQPSSIAEGIWLWSTEYGDGESFFNSYLIQTADNAAVLIDPFFNDLNGKPLMDWSVFETLPPPTAIWLTNSDHERDSARFQKQFDIPVLAAKAEADDIGVRLGDHLKPDTQLDGGWQVLLLADQKTPAECVFYQAQRQLLVVGDALLSQADGRLRRPYDAPCYKDEDKAKAGLHPLKDLPVKGILVGHGSPIFHNAQKKLCDALAIDPRIIAESA